VLRGLPRRKKGHTTASVRRGVDPKQLAVYWYSAKQGDGREEGTNYTRQTGIHTWKQRDDGGDPRELVRGVKERNHSVFNRKRETGNESKRETRTPETKAASKTNTERNTSNSSLEWMKQEILLHGLALLAAASAVEEMEATDGRWFSFSRRSSSQVPALDTRRTIAKEVRSNWNWLG